uniref:Uncharacterized protein n=1 Tax=Abalone asfa-like virus TaxID=2839893 RepID=A0A5K7XZB5_9VIRU|nr:hypothetical protein [Abalone asfa-like virus]BCY04608.1 hypothetical protein [Abalone asfa-like virus]
MAQIPFYATTIRSGILSLERQDRDFKVLEHKNDHIWLNRPQRILVDDTKFMIKKFNENLPFIAYGNFTKQAATVVSELIYEMMDQKKCRPNLHYGKNRKDRAIFLDGHEIDREKLIRRMIIDVFATLSRAVGGPASWGHIVDNKLIWVMSVYISEQKDLVDQILKKWTNGHLLDKVLKSWQYKMFQEAKRSVITSSGW